MYEEAPIRYPFYLLIGRIIGDDEDTISQQFEDVTDEEAYDKFIAYVKEEFPDSAEAAASEDDHGIMITQVVTSNSKMDHTNNA